MRISSFRFFSIRIQIYLSPGDERYFDRKRGIVPFLWRFDNSRYSSAFASMVVMVQWEIAERMTALPNTSVYSSLAVLVQSIADVTIIRRLAPTVFWPKPQVDSAIVKIVPNPEKRKKVGNVQKFRVFLRDLYSHRRKNLRGALVGWPSGRREKPDVDRKLAEIGIDGSLRAENLDIDQHLRLCAAFE